MSRRRVHRLIRARMKRNQETYATARRHVLADLGAADEHQHDLRVRERLRRERA